MKGFQRVVGCLLAVGFLGMMPTPAIAAETSAVIEMPYASSLTAKRRQYSSGLAGQPKGARDHSENDTGGFRCLL